MRLFYPVLLALGLPLLVIAQDSTSVTSQLVTQPGAPSDDPIATQADIEQLENRLTQLNRQFERLTNKNIQFGLNVGYRFLTGESRNKNQNASISPIDSTLQLVAVEDGSFLLSTSVLFNPRLPTQQLSENIRKQILFHLSEKYSANATIEPADRLLIDAIVPNAKMKVKTNSDLNTLFDRIDTLPYEAGTITPPVIYNFTQQLREKINKETDQFKRRQLRKLKNRVRWLVFKQFVTDYLIDRIAIYANLNLIEFSTAQQELSFNQSIEGGLGFSYQLNPNLHVGLNWENIRSRQLQPYLQELAGQQLYINGSPVSSIDQLDPDDDDLYRTRNLSALSIKVIASF